jgi:hypothetical protein
MLKTGQAYLLQQIENRPRKNWAFPTDSNKWGAHSVGTGLALSLQEVDDFPHTDFLSGSVCSATFVETCQRFGVETVPVVATIPFDLGEVKRYSEGKTLLLTEDAYIRE